MTRSRRSSRSHRWLCFAAPLLLSCASAPDGDTQAEPAAEGEPATPRGEQAARAAIEVLRGTLAKQGAAKPIEKLEPRQFDGLSLLWSAQVGQTTFRSTMQLHKGKLVVPSNGRQLAGVNDRLDGVWILEAKTGKSIRQIVPPGGDEKDSNGVAVTDDAIFFGTDQERLYRYDWNGSKKWSLKLKGDPEAAPALADFNEDGKPDIVIGTDQGRIYAVNGESGKQLWEYATGKGDYGQSGVWGEAAVFDVTGDGISDAFVPARDQMLHALDGKTGAKLWNGWGGSGRWGAPIVIDGNNDGRMELYATESYGTLTSYDPSNGQHRWSASARIGLKGPVGYFPSAQCVAIASAWFGQDEEVSCFDVRTGSKTWSFPIAEKNVTSGFVAGDINGTPGDELVFGTESGMLYALDLEGKVIWEESVGGPVEATPMLADVDGDEHTDIIVAVNDGFLRVYRSAGRPSPTIGHHRGGNANGGRL